MKYKTKFTALIGLVLVSPVATMLPASAQDDNTSGRWPRESVVTVRMSPSVKGQGFKVTRHINTWSQLIAPYGITVKRVSAGNSYADITVSYYAAGVPGYKGSAAGISYVTFNKWGKINGCDMDLGGDYDPIWRPRVFGHEFGHCLGLPHVTELSIMDQGYDIPPNYLPGPVEAAQLAAVYASY